MHMNVHCVRHIRLVADQDVIEALVLIDMGHLRVGWDYHPWVLIHSRARTLKAIRFTPGMLVLKTSPLSVVTSLAAACLFLNKAKSFAKGSVYPIRSSRCAGRGKDLALP